MKWTKIFTGVKTYATAIVVGVIGVLMAALKIKTAQYKNQKKRATNAEGAIKEAVKIVKHDVEVDIQVDKHLADVVHGDDDELTHPNDWD